MARELTPEQELEAQKLAAQLAEQANHKLLEMARLLVSTTNSTLFGSTEFELRDLSHQLASSAIETFLQKKTDTKDLP